MKKFLLLVSVSLLLFSACSKKKEVLRVGATPVPHAELLQFIKEDLKKEGVDMEIVVFTDYINPNVALNDKQLDANFMQHVPYLLSFNEDRNYNLIPFATIHIEPMGLYSKKIKDLNELKKGDTVALPNDPTNEGRALLLLNKNNLIKLKAGTGLNATVSDIAENPLGLKFKELEAALLPRVLNDVDAAVINGNYAIDAGLNPVIDALIIEETNSPYANVVAVREDNIDDPRLSILIKVLTSQRVKEHINNTYSGGVLAAF